jgi:hypothetical protein
MPSKGKDGTIYFQRISKFQRKPDSDSEERKKADADADDRKSTCLFIAYFYIRIFQIYGSLALTLIDDVRSFVENGVIQSAAEYMKSINKLDLQMGDPLGSVGAPFGQRSIQRGGADVNPIEGKQIGDNKAETVLGDTELRFLLHQSIIPVKTALHLRLPVFHPRDKTLSKTITYGFKTTVGKVYVNVDKPSSDAFIDEENEGFFAFLLPSTPNMTMIVQLPFSSQVNSDKSITVKFDKSMIICTYFKNVKKDTTDIHSLVNGLLGYDSTKRSFQMEFRGEYYNIKNTRVYFNSILIAIQEYLEKVMNELVTSIERQDKTVINTSDEMIERSIDMSRLLQGRSRSGWDGRRPDEDLFGRDAYGRRYDRDAYDMYGRRTDYRQDEKLDRFMATDTKAHEAIRLSNILKALGTTRPYAYCVSRGLRLLSAVQQATPPGWKSSVCDTKFLVDRTVPHDGAPSQDKTIDSSPGIVALSQLFFDTVKSTTSDITMSPQSLRQYTTFLAQMYQLYTGEDPQLSKLDPAEKPLTKIKPTFAQSVCTPKKITYVPNEGVNEVWSRVKALFNRQMVHSANCGALFKELFFIKRLASGVLYVSIHPNVIKRGIPELDRLTTKARNLLTKYYADCENGYRAGITIIASATAAAAERDAAKSNQTAAVRARNEAIAKGQDPNKLPQLGQDPNKPPQQGQDPNRLPQQGQYPNKPPQLGQDPNQVLQGQDPNQVLQGQEPEQTQKLPPPSRNPTQAGPFISALKQPGNNPQRDRRITFANTVRRGGSRRTRKRSY